MSTPFDSTVSVASADPFVPRALLAGLRRVGARPVPCESGREVERAGSLVFSAGSPFGTAAHLLERRGLKHALRARILEGRPTLAIGTAMQLFAMASEESPGAVGLEILKITIRRFRGDLVVPHLGWNIVVPEFDTELLKESHTYFSNAYCMERAPKDWSVAWSEYGGPFVAAIQRGSVLACQFHPELLGKSGLEPIRNWLEQERMAC